MIPDYLRGKSAAKILDEVKGRIVSSSEEGTFFDRYVAYADAMLLIAITHALCNADEVLVESADKAFKDMVRSQEAEGRAIAFLNMVLPKEIK